MKVYQNCKLYDPQGKGSCAGAWLAAIMEPSLILHSAMYREDQNSQKLETARAWPYTGKSYNENALFL